MRFGKKLYYNAVPEWHEKYIDYSNLKKQLKRIQQCVMTSGVGKAACVTQDSLFWELMEHNADIVEEFYKQKVTEVQVVLSQLIQQVLALGLISEYKPQQIPQLKMLSEFQRLSHLPTALQEEIQMKSRSIRHRHDKDGSLRTSDQLDEDDVKHINSTHTTTTTTRVVSLKSTEQKQAYTKLKHGFWEFYRGLVLVQNFCTLNSEGFAKITKKYDKKFATSMKREFMRTKIETSSFFDYSVLKRLLEETEYIYAQAFSHGIWHDAMKDLRLPTKSHQSWLTFRLGTFFGCILPLLVFVIYWFFTVDSFEYGRSVLIVYRGICLCIMLVLMWGIDMYVWSRNRINHVFIFDFDPRHHFTFHVMFEGAACFTMMCLLSVVTYFFSCAPPSSLAFFSKCPPAVYPLVFVIISVIVFFIYEIRTRFWLLFTLISIIAAPLKAVKFKDFFFADQLVSLSIVFADIEYTMCFYFYEVWFGGTKCDSASKITRPLFASLPALWRLLQCLRLFHDTRTKRHLANAGKYFTSIVVSMTSLLYGTFPKSTECKALWICCISFATIYNYSWDTYFDWGLGRRFSKNKFLRDVLMYERKWIYYTASVVNLILRLSWTLTISPEAIGVGSIIDLELFRTILACLEILRRGVWNIFRVENEHITNCTLCRATKDFKMPIDL
ncbi:xenotropic and polytropic retrovirus receptor 1 [Pelomyxa schiedti]|nr:xenotropic and polytropic retrovirus receptor 1 [Pelomyxa schiedti]